MLCLEISVNGERKCLAGHEQMDRLRASLYVTKDGPRLLIADAYLEPNEAHAFWPSLEPRINDHIEIRVIESESPEKPSRLEPHIDTKRKAVEELVYCSLCGKNHEEVRKMVTAEKVNVCNECVLLLTEMVNEA